MFQGVVLWRACLSAGDSAPGGHLRGAETRLRSGGKAHLREQQNYQGGFSHCMCNGVLGAAHPLPFSRRSTARARGRRQIYLSSDLGSRRTPGAAETRLRKFQPGGDSVAAPLCGLPPPFRRNAFCSTSDRPDVKLTRHILEVRRPLGPEACGSKRTPPPAYPHPSSF